MIFSDKSLNSPLTYYKYGPTPNEGYPHWYKYEFKKPAFDHTSDIRDCEWLVKTHL